jgi:hypothetical protein
MYKKDGLPFVNNTGQVGMNAVFNGPRQMDINAMQDPYSGAMTKMDPTALGVADQVFGTQQQRQHVMNMQPGLAKLEKHALNKMLPEDPKEGINKLPTHVQKKMGYTETHEGDPLKKNMTPNFNRQYASVDPATDPGQFADYSGFRSGIFGMVDDDTPSATSDEIDVKLQQDKENFDQRDSLEKIASQANKKLQKI